MWTRVELKEKAKTAFHRNYWIMVLVGLIFTFISYSPANARSGYEAARDYTQDVDAGSILDYISTNVLIMGITILLIWALVIAVAKIFLGNLLYIGCMRFFMENSEKKASLSLVLKAFQQGRYGNQVLTMFLKDLFIFLWTLLLIVPGIIKSYEYSMVPYILAENPDISRKRAFQISKSMMMGEKWNTFVLDLSFIGWFILSGITFGIVGVLYVTPYHQGTWAELYKMNRYKVLSSGGVTSQELLGF